jgi:hypothetical protein
MSASFDGATYDPALDGPRLGGQLALARDPLRCR